MSPHPAPNPGAPIGTGGPLAGVRRVVRHPLSRWGFVLVMTGFAVVAVVRQWPQVRSALTALGYPAVLGALVAILAAMFAAMQVWRVLLAALGSTVSARIAARVVFVGQLGKYLPGSVWPVLAQMELASAHRVPRARSATATVLAMLVSLLGALLVALVTLPFVAPAMAPYRWVFWAAPVLLVGLHPRVLNPALNRVLRWTRGPVPERPLRGRAVAAATGWSLVSWLLYGTQIWLLAARLGLPAGRGAVLAVGVFAFAWSVGFLVVFAPAGAGVREVILVAGLGPVVGVGAATTLALVSRVLMTAGDLVTAGAATWFGGGATATSPEPHEPGMARGWGRFRVVRGATEPEVEPDSAHVVEP